MATSRASFVLLRDELLEREAFDTLLEAKVLIERWRQVYNTVRPHSAGLYLSVNPYLKN
jgi:transposase InsO family protein